MKRDTLIATTYAGAICGIMADRFIIGASWPAFVLVVVGLIALGALHVHHAQSLKRDRAQTNWPL